MPHKHTRRGEDKTTVDLPPTVIAEPLPVAKSAKPNGIFTTEKTDARKAKKRNRNTDDGDDTPKAFKRLMSFREGKILPKGLDDGVKPTKKQKRAASEGALTGINKATESEALSFKVPDILPGERMSDFSARVDAALPISGLINKTARGKDPLGLKVARTKKEKKMHKMYDEWREQDRKIKEKRQEALELAAADEEDEESSVKWKIDMEVAEQVKTKKSKRKKSRVIGEVDDGRDKDPWAAVARARNEEPAKLNDVVQAPPEFTKVPKERFKARGASVNIEHVPKTAGSLRRREELGEVRKGVVEKYRQLMKENKAAGRY